MAGVTLFNFCFSNTITSQMLKVGCKAKENTKAEKIKKVAKLILHHFRF